MEPKTWVIGDIHGAFKALRQALERANPAPEDTLIFLGDYVDGWSEAPEVIDGLITLQQLQPCIFLRGNHDELCREWLLGGSARRQWLDQGGSITVEAYKTVSDTVKAKHIHFLNSLQNYHLDKKNRLFLHAGFTNLHGVTHEYFPELFYWDRTLWETALCLDPSLPKTHPAYPKRLLHYDEIYIGHTPVTRIGKTIPVQAANVWNTDTGAAYGYPLSVMDIETKNVWQSDPIAHLYPGEKGRTP